MIFDLHLYCQFCSRFLLFNTAHPEKRVVVDLVPLTVDVCEGLIRCAPTTRLPQLILNSGVPLTTVAV